MPERTRRRTATKMSRHPWFRCVLRVTAQPKRAIDRTLLQKHQLQPPILHHHAQHTFSHAKAMAVGESTPQGLLEGQIGHHLAIGGHQRCTEAP